MKTKLIVSAINGIASKIGGEGQDRNNKKGIVVTLISILSFLLFLIVVIISIILLPLRAIKDVTLIAFKNDNTSKIIKYIETPFYDGYDNEFVYPIKEINRIYKVSDNKFIIKINDKKDKIEIAAISDGEVIDIYKNIYNEETTLTVRYSGEWVEEVETEIEAPNETEEKENKDSEGNEEKDENKDSEGNEKKDENKEINPENDNTSSDDKEESNGKHTETIIEYVTHYYDFDITYIGKLKCYINNESEVLQGQFIAEASDKNVNCIINNN